MRASQILKTVLKRRKCSYQQYADLLGITKNAVYLKTKIKKYRISEITKQLHALGYRIFVIHEDDLDLNTCPKALELTGDLDEVKYDLTCSHCGGKLEDIYIQEGLCPHCGKDIDSYLYPLSPVGNEVFQPKKHTGRPIGSKDSYKRERKCEGEPSKAKFKIKKTTKKTEEKLDKIKINIKDLNKRKEEMENDLRLLQSINYDTDD